MKDNWERKIRDQIVDNLQGRRICITKGGLLGLVPEGSKEGDIICVFLGSPAPVVGRRNGDMITIIGISYFHGLMRGEGISQSQSKIQDIIIG